MAQLSAPDTTGSNNYEPAVHTSTEQCTTVTVPNQSWILAGIPVLASGSWLKALVLIGVGFKTVSACRMLTIVSFILSPKTNR